MGVGAAATAQRGVAVVAVAAWVAAEWEAAEIGPAAAAALDEEEMVDDLSEGDVAETIGKFYEQSKTVIPPKKSELGLHQVDAFFDQLATVC